MKKEFIISERHRPRRPFWWVWLPLSKMSKKVKEYLDELAFLADTAGGGCGKAFARKWITNSVTFCPGQINCGSGSMW